jgi:ABC-2 type transport system permease protein
MNKLWTITGREYLIRVKSKSFILATLLTPLAFGAFFVFSALLGAYSSEKDQKVLVVDEGNQTGDFLPTKGTFIYTYSGLSEELAKVEYEKEEYDILLNVPVNTDTLNKRQATYESKEKIGISSIDKIENDLEDAFRKQRVEDSKIDKGVLEAFDVKVNVENAEFLASKGKSNESKLNAIVGTGIGFLMGFMMYMVIFIYGGMVMRSVMEEKINRIVEVIISSVKPFQLMLGKIIGVGAVGLTQLAVWLILIPVILLVISLFMGIDGSQYGDMANMNTGIPQEQLNDLNISNLILELGRMNWFIIIPVFVLCFLGGYFIYASMFAAIGAAMGDDMGESQSLMIPIIVPVIIAFTMLMPIMNNPNGNLAIFGSMFPLFSPILLPARLAFDPPLWQIALSLILMIGTAVGMIWLSGRIYRVGILLYGKKTSLKEIAKWMFYKS